MTHTKKYKRSTLFSRLCMLYIFISLCAVNVNTLADADYDASNKNSVKYEHKQKSQKIKNKQKSRSRNSQYYSSNYRYNDKHYPKLGYSVRTLPKKHHTSRFKNRDYFFNDGIWYTSYGTDFRVVIAPAGIRIAKLPSRYSTIWHNRRAYYYANSTYYIWEPTYNSYVVVDQPESIQTREPPLVEEDLYVYPAQGQSDTQLADDRYACHARGRDATQYDPTSPPSGVSNHILSNMRADYLSIMRGCLLELGYSVQ